MIRVIIGFVRVIFLLVLPRRLGLKTRKIAPHKQLVKPGFLSFINTSTPKNTSSVRHILTSYPFTKAMSEKAYLSANAY